MASAAFESVGRRAMGRYIEGSDFRPDRFQRAVTCAILKTSGKWPISKQLLKTLDKENEIGVAIMLMNFPEMPQCEIVDFLSCLKTLDTSMGDVLIELRLEETFHLGEEKGQDRHFLGQKLLLQRGHLKVHF